MRRWGVTSWSALAIGAAIASFPVSLAWIIVGGLGAASTACFCMAVVWAVAWQMRERVPEGERC